jgi:hypothetical protein
VPAIRRALLAFAIILGASLYDGVPPHIAPLYAESCYPETGALQQGQEPQARNGMSEPSFSSTRFESADGTGEQRTQTSPRASSGGGHPRLWAPVVSSRSGQVWARR